MAAPIEEHIDGLHKLLIIGGGSAGTGIIIRAARTGMLKRLLDPQKHGKEQDLELSKQLQMTQKGVVIVHDGDSSTFGSGILGNYLVNANTFARGLVLSVLDDRLDLDPPESIGGTFLEKAVNLPSAKVLEEIGNAPGTLSQMGAFLNDVGKCLLQELEQHSTSAAFLESRVTRLDTLANGTTRVTIEREDRTITLLTEKVVFACGGTGREPPGIDAFKDKLFKSDDCLVKDGFAQLKEHLRAQGPNSKVCIVGGSHSSFSVAWLLLGGNAHLHHDASGLLVSPGSKVAGASSAPHAASTATTPSATPAATSAPGSKAEASADAAAAATTQLEFQPGAISILHRHPIRCFYWSIQDATADGMEGCTPDRSGCVNTFTGLREDSKHLYHAIRSGKEPRVALISLPTDDDAVVAAIETPLFEAATAIVATCGYATRLVPVFDADGNPLVFAESKGVVEVDMNARLQLQDLTPEGTGKSPRPLEHLLGVGIGFSLPAHSHEMGCAVRADGVAVYQRRGAILALAAVFGTEAFGVDCNSFEDMIDKYERKRLEMKAASSAPSSPCKSPMKKDAATRKDAAGSKDSPVKKAVPAPNSKGSKSSAALPTATATDARATSPAPVMSKPQTAASTSPAAVPADPPTSTASGLKRSASVATTPTIDMITKSTPVANAAFDVTSSPLLEGMEEPVTNPPIKMLLHRHRSAGSIRPVSPLELPSDAGSGSGSGSTTMAAPPTTTTCSSASKAEMVAAETTKPIVPT